MKQNTNAVNYEEVEKRIEVREQTKEIDTPKGIVDFLEKNVEIVKMKDAPKELTDFAMILQNAEGKKKQIYFENPKIENSNAILEELESFADAIENQTTPIVSLENGTKALEVANIIIDSYSS